MAKEIVRNDALDRVYMALDYFDASINRVLALGDRLQELAESPVNGTVHAE